MAHWDVFHSDRLELERSLSTAEVRAALARGDLTDDDLIRPSGANAPWARIGDQSALLASEPAPEAPESAPAPPPTPVPGPLDAAEHAIIPDMPSESFGEFDLNFRDAGEAKGAHPSDIEEWDDSVELDVGHEAIAEDGIEADEEYDPLEEDEAVAEFTLSRSHPERVEELDLAAMVDVAFQMVLFFLVTATTVLYKTLEVPKPNPENRPTASAAQGRAKTIDELKDDFILVEIDPAGLVKIEHEPVPAERAALVERLRAERERTNRKAMLLSADFATPHKSAVLAYDAANEIGLGIAIARPSPGPSAPPSPSPPAPAAKEGGL